MEQIRTDVADLNTRFARLEAGILDNLARLAVDAGKVKPSRSDRVWDISTKIAAPVVVAAVIYLFNLAGRVSYIEATRFTALDFQTRMTEIEKKLLAAAEGPTWLRSELVSINVKMDALKESSARLSERVVRLEAKIDKENR